MPKCLIEMAYRNTKQKCPIEMLMKWIIKIPKRNGIEMDSGNAQWKCPIELTNRNR